jgi:hypothetical protein
MMSADVLGEKMLVEHCAQQQPTELLAVPLRPVDQLVRDGDARVS